MSDDLVFSAEFGPQKYIAGLNKAEKATKEFGATTAKSFKVADIAVGAFIGNFTTNIAFSALQNFKAALGDVTREFLEFDKAIKEINTILPKNTKLTQKQIDSLRKLSAQFGTSPAVQAKAFYQIISAGITDVTEATLLLDSANKVTLGGIGDLQSSVNVLTDIINVYGAENITAQEASDSLFQTVKLGKTTIEQLSGSIGLVIPVAAKLNVGLDTVNSALATMTTQGLTTSQRVTQLNSLFISLFDSAEDIEKKFGKDIAAAFSATALRTKGLGKFLQDLMDVTGGNEEVLRKLIGRKEGFQAVLALTGSQVSKYNDTLEQMKDKQGAAATAAEGMKEAVDVQYDIFIQNIKNMANAYGDDLAPSIKRALITANLFFKSLDDETKVEKLTTRLAQLRNEAEKIEVSGLKDTSLSLFLRDIEIEMKAVAEEIKELNRLDDPFNTMVSSTAGLEEELKGLKNEMALVNTGLDTTKSVKEISALQSQISELESKLASLKGEDAAEDPTIKAKENADALTNIEKAKIADINALKEEQRATEEELRLTDIDTQRALTEEEFENLQAIEEEKINIKFQAEETKNNLIKESSKRELAIKETAAKKDLELTKLALKQNAKFGKQMQLQTIKNESEIQNAKLGFARSSATALVNIAGAGSKAAFAISQAFAITDIIVKAEQAKALALATIPFPPAQAAQIAHIESLRTIGLATVAAQALATVTAPSFANGGIVPGTSFVGDNVSANVNSGELILNQAQQETTAGNLVSNADLLQSIDDKLAQLINKDTSINIDGKAIATTVKREIEDGFIL